MSQKYEVEREMAALPKDVRDFLKRVMTSDSAGRASVYCDDKGNISGFQDNGLTEEERKEFDRLKKKYNG